MPGMDRRRGFAPLAGNLRVNDPAEIEPSLFGSVESEGARQQVQVLEYLLQKAIWPNAI